MNVALTQAKYFLFVIARCKFIVVNPYWNELVNHACETRLVVKISMANQLPELSSLEAEVPPPLRPIILVNKHKRESDYSEEGKLS